MSVARTTPSLRIGELAAELGLNPKTLRYYEMIGLLSAPRRSAGGYRLYDPTDLERLRFIAKAKAVGLTLQEIGEVLALHRQGQQPCGHVVTLLDRKLGAVDQQLRALAEFRQELVGLREEAADTMTATACVCGIIELHQPARPDDPGPATALPLLQQPSHGR